MYSRNVGEGSVVRVCVPLVARLVRLVHAHDKSLATAHHRLRSVAACTLAGTELHDTYYCYILIHINKDSVGAML